MTARLTRLSNRAVDLATALPTTDPTRIARWLYHYGSIPRGPLIEQNFGIGDDTMAVLGLTLGDVSRRTLEAAYEASTYPGWFSFALTPSPVLTQAACKLYISPMPEALASAFPVIAETFVVMNVRSFKVGRGIEGLLRPDKIVAYFDNRADLDRVAAQLCQRLKHCPVQGVPFTADAGLDGLLSWGIDPPPSAEALSWRSWITQKLAHEIVKAKAATDTEVAATALASVSALGVNTSLWMADSRLFGAES